MMSAQLNPPPGSATAPVVPAAQHQATAGPAESSTTHESFGPPLRNRAGESTNPFIRAHADTLVHWQMLDDEALARAKADNKLIFLTIGFLASHCEHPLQSPRE